MADAPKPAPPQIDPALESEHQNSYGNRYAILASQLVGCFCCLSLMEPKEVKEYVRDHAPTGLCRAVVLIACCQEWKTRRRGFCWKCERRTSEMARKRGKDGE